jgi:DNA-binding NarL/FixJ family response regulator
LTTVLLADLPPMLEDTVRSVLQSRPDLEVIRASTRDQDLIDAAAAAGAHVVVVTRRDPADLWAVDPRLAQAAAVSVIALSPNGAWACLHKLHPAATRLEDLSTAQILAALAATAPMGTAP